MNDELLQRHLPSYLLPKDRKELVEHIKNFPTLEGKSFYSNALSDKDYVFQGDGFVQFTFMNLLESKTRVGQAMVISNTCDLSMDNDRPTPINLMYAPISPLSNFERDLRASTSGQRADGVMDAVRKNKYTHILFLPECLGVISESIVRLDMIHNISPRALFNNPDWKKQRLFSLSQFGFYTTIFKLSIHFHRVMEGVDRNAQVDS